MEGLDPRQSPRKVVGVDIDILPHNRKALDEHPLRFKMELIEGSSIAPEIIQQVRSYADGVDQVLVSVGSYCIRSLLSLSSTHWIISQYSVSSYELQVQTS